MSTPPGPGDDRSEPSDRAGGERAGDEAAEASDGEPIRSPDSTGSGAARGDPPFGAAVDDRWWWWIAAVPVHFVVSLGFGLLFFLVAAFGMLTGGMVGHGMDPGPMLPGAFGLLFAAALLLVVLPGLVLALALPLALYVDARAVAAAPDVDWEPDAALYGLLALAGLAVSGTLLGVVLALYYLYRRHDAVGVP